MGGPCERYNKEQKEEGRGGEKPKEVGTNRPGEEKKKKNSDSGKCVVVCCVEGESPVHTCEMIWC